MFYKVWLPLIILASAIAGIAFSIAYQRLRRPGWAPTADKIKVPYAGWIIIVILVLSLGFVIFLALQDPLKGAR